MVITEHGYTLIDTRVSLRYGGIFDDYTKTTCYLVVFIVFGNFKERLDSRIGSFCAINGNLIFNVTTMKDENLIVVTRTDRNGYSHSTTIGNTYGRRVTHILG